MDNKQDIFDRLDWYTKNCFGTFNEFIVTGFTEEELEQLKNGELNYKDFIPGEIKYGYGVYGHKIADGKLICKVGKCCD